LVEDGAGSAVRAGAVAFVLKGYPRLSETFIAQEIAELERRGLDIRIVALRHPTDKRRHPIHGEIRASVDYLPEYLWREPIRVLRAWWQVRHWPGYRLARQTWLDDLRRDPTPNRVRRFGQALVLARELPPEVRRLHAHFLHTPASVVRYTAALRGIKWTASAHAKDVWTTPQWELREKLASCEWLVTCTAANAAYLGSLAPPGRVELAYHGLDLSRFAMGAGQGSQRNGDEAADPVLLLSVGRLVEKKGTDVLLEALACLPQDLSWRLIHAGGGPLGRALRKRAAALGIAQRIRWLGALPQDELLVQYRRADLFALACRIADDGDRDGLPNVLMEAQSQALACVATDVSAVRELIEDGVNGALVEAERPVQFAQALERLMRDPALRRAMGRAGQARVVSKFSMQPNIARLAQKFGLGV
jgi:glycosyltransferase involved in cell wall biosynthesis